MAARATATDARMTFIFLELYRLSGNGGGADGPPAVRGYFHTPAVHSSSSVTSTVAFHGVIGSDRKKRRDMKIRKLPGKWGVVPTILISTPLRPTSQMSTARSSGSPLV